ncbi:MAG: UDP-N-acetyl-D-glucosamine 2-epimerase, UDP-hydrolysing [Bdellovibrionales bacterium RIFOXYD1_FULL_53_11]|nr:MAG: UDP-N-acetyl-D-glucosamine 2-epimerase, UDP-hydrolysing [Bdellovibrionales bacterium RIFOXYD1_FULL_53_11]
MNRSSGNKSNRKRLLFLTGTRADFGKLKPLIRAIEKSDEFECHIFATGMHTLSRYGSTVIEVYKEGFRNVQSYINQVDGESMDMVLANTIQGLSRFVRECRPDLIVVHGDRVEAMAGAIVGSLQNILVAHVEGGELSGTIDGLIRHSVSKLSHIHFVSNQDAAVRLRQLGEDPASIFVIGSPDIDIMLSPDLKPVEQVKKHYDIGFDRYSLLLFHPVTTEAGSIARQASQLATAVIEDGSNYVVIHPNNDAGCETILGAFGAFEGNNRFRVFPSLRFEWFLSLLKHADFIIGNSSSGIHEAPVYAIPAINIGSRQDNRFQHESIIDCPADKGAILEAMGRARKLAGKLKPSLHFGTGNGAEKFREIIASEKTWNVPRQKKFLDLK